MWKKVIAPTVLVSLLWVAVSATTTFYLNKMDDAQTRLAYSNRDTIQAAGRMQEVLWRLQAAVMDAGQHDHRLSQSDMDSLERMFMQAFESAQASASTPAEVALIPKIRSEFKQYQANIRRLEAPGISLDDDDNDTVEESMALARSTAATCQELFEIAQRLVGNSFERRDQLRARVTWIRMGFLFAGPALGLLFGFYVAKGLHRSISEISVTLRDASGDLEQEVGRVELRSDESRCDLPSLQHQVHEVATQIRHVAGELQQARKDAVRAERLAAVGELAAGVAHELRNPLTAVKLLIQTAAQRGDGQPPLDAKRLSVIQQEVARMETTIQGLLDFARPPQLRRIPHDVRETLRRALNLVIGRADHQAVSIHEDLPVQPVIVNGDPEQLDQVFVNLLINGIESMEDGGDLQVSMQADPTTGRCVLQFADNGRGIPDGIIDRVFEPFVTNKPHGVGLGLAISSRIIREHAGSLTAANRESHGALFSIDLPLAALDAPLAEHPASVVRRGVMAGVAGDSGC